MPEYTLDSLLTLGVGEQGDEGMDLARLGIALNLKGSPQFVVEGLCHSVPLDDLLDTMCVSVTSGGWRHRTVVILHLHQRAVNQFNRPQLAFLVSPAGGGDILVSTVWASGFACSVVALDIE